MLQGMQNIIIIYFLSEVAMIVCKLAPAETLPLWNNKKW